MLTPQEKERRRLVRQECKKKNLALFYKEFGVNHRTWLQELARKYKERGKYPLSPLILSDYYKDYEDKLLATLIACFLLDDNNRVMQQVLPMKSLLGEHPYKDLYSNRAFVQLSNGANQTKPISYFGSVKCWKVAKLLDIVWAIEHDNGKPLFDVLFDMIMALEYTPYHALFSLFSDLPVERPEYRINLALLRLCSKDGISTHLWDIGGLERKLKCPFDKGIKSFMENWLPRYAQTFTFAEACRIMGFESEVDFYYSYLGFKELSLYRPQEVRDYIHLYSIQYNHRQMDKDGRRRLRNKIPNIEFGD
jgi:hypothetical protein